MKIKLFLFSVLAFTLRALEIGTPDFCAEIMEKGGALQRFEWRDRSLISIGKPSMLDFPHSGQNGIVTTEKFDQLSYTLEKKNGNCVETKVTGKAAFNKLELTKIYTIDPGKKRLDVEYTLRNIGSTPLKISNWTKTFCRRDDEMNPPVNNAVMPQENGKVQIFPHQHGAHWMLPVKQCWMGIFSAADKTGVIMELPQECSGSAFIWFSGAGRAHNTMEFFSREFTLAPGAKVSYKLGFQASENVPAGIQAYSRPAKACALPFSLWEKKMARRAPQIKVDCPQYGKIELPQKYTFKIPRQQQPAVRVIEIAPEYDLAKLKLTPALPCRLEGRKLFVEIPGIPNRSLQNCIFRDGHIFDRYMKVLKDYGADTVPVTVSFDGSGISDKRCTGTPELIPNGGFEIPCKTRAWPIGFPMMWSFSQRGMDVQYVTTGAPEGSRCMRLAYPAKAKRRPELRAQFRAEPGRQYQLSALVKFQLPAKAPGQVRMEYFDAEWKPVPGPKPVIFETNNSIGWTKVTAATTAPVNAFFGRLSVCAYRRGDCFEVDAISIVPAPYLAGGENRLAEYRRRLKNGWIPSLDIIEELDGEYGLPGVRWFKNPAQPMPDVLFCCAMQTGSDMFWNTSKHQIADLARRYPLNFRYIALLPRVMNAETGFFGVHPRTFAPELDDYSMELMRQAKPAKLIVLSGADFKQIQQEFSELLKKQQNSGAGILFLNCKNIPPALLGGKLQMKQGIFAVPQLKRVSVRDQESICKLYSNRTAEISGFEPDRFQRSRFQATLPERSKFFYDNLHSFDFPDWDYAALVQLKALRHAAGIVPAVEIWKISGNTIFVMAKKNFSGSITVNWKDLHNRIERASEQTVKLPKGYGKVILAVPQLSGGTHIAEFRILDQQNRTVDAGALLCKTPETVKMDLRFAKEDRCFETGKPVRFTVELSSVPENATLETLVYDSRMRLVYCQESPAKKSNQLSFTPQFPFTTIYSCFVTLKLDYGNIAQTSGEFSLPFVPLDLKDMHAQVNCHTRNLYLLPELGFDMVMANHRNGGVRNLLRAIRLYGLTPHTRGVGSAVPGVYARAKFYRHDAATDPVRDPCFTSPAYQKEQHKNVVAVSKKDLYRYYNITHHTLDDEAFLGSTVCYSPSCLAVFRLWLKGRYRDLAELNRSWNTNFTSWEKVMPCQFKELTDMNRLARWLEHKLFMSDVHAVCWLGATRDYLREVVPSSVTGLSGTQQPGFGYNWDTMMKYADFICYYSGAQGKMVQDFSSDARLVGPCLPNCEAQVHDQGRLSNCVYGSLFNGSNLSWMYFGNKMSSMKPTPSMLDYSQIIRSVKSGPAKLILSAEPAFRQTAVLYSQPSLFAAKALGRESEWQNSYNGWEALLNDLGIDFRFLRSEELTGLDPAKTKVLILPLVLSLSQQERAAIAGYIKRGGTVIADQDAGLFDGHGNRTDEKVPDIKLMHENLASYQSVHLGGVGGELAAVQTGNAAVVERLRSAADTLLQKAGVVPSATVRDMQGKEYPCRITLRRDGTNYVLGIYIPTGDAVVDPAKKIMLSVELPVKGFVYDTRSAEKLGFTNFFTTAIAHGIPAIFTIQQHEADRFQVEVPTAVKRGDPFEVRFSAGAAPQVFHCRLIQPDGKEPVFFWRNIRSTGEKAGQCFQIALNEPAGVWQVEVRHISSGTVIRKNIKVE